MSPDISVFLGLFVDTLGYWWIIIPATILGVVVGAIPGFSAANTIIILLPITLSMEPATGMIFMVALYTSSRLICIFCSGRTYNHGRRINTNTLVIAGSLSFTQRRNDRGNAVWYLADRDDLSRG